MGSMGRSPDSGRSSTISRKSTGPGVPRLRTDFSNSSASSARDSSTSSLSQQISADGARKSESEYFSTAQSPWSPVYSAQTSPTYPSSYAPGITTHGAHRQFYHNPSSHSNTVTTPVLPSHSKGPGRYNDESSPSHYSRQSDSGQDALKPVSPTWFGWVEYTEDALKLIEACITHRLKRIQRRPDENERPRIIQNGAVFVFDETTTGILRWTDDRHWSPSRVRGSFMLYRELDSKVPPGEKKKALKKQKLSPTELSMPSHRSTSDRSRREDESSVRGSHNDSYLYKMDEGLMKRTFSAYYGETKWSVISYYDPNAAEAGLLPKVSEDPNLKDIQPRQDIVGKILQGTASTPKGSRRGSLSTYKQSSASREHEHLYGLHQQPMSSYPGQPMCGISAGHMSYPPSIQHGASSYDHLPITPSYYHQSNSYGVPLRQTHGQSFSQPQADQPAINFQPNQNDQHPHMYNTLPPQQQPGPVMDPRPFQERATQDHRDSFAPPLYAARPQYRQSSYYYDPPSDYSASRPDAPHLEVQQQQQQQRQQQQQQQLNLEAWLVHDQKYFPPPSDARPN